MSTLSITWILVLFFLQPACMPSKHAENLNIDSSTAIIGGSTVPSNRYPFAVNIWLYSPQDLFVGHLCGASLIHSKWVLTAAHCVLQDASDPTSDSVKLGDIRLYIGSLNTDGKGGRLLKPLRLHVHPQFSFPSYDIALIELTEPVFDIQPVHLMANGFGDDIEDQRATVIGWGLIDELGQIESPVLRETSLNLISVQSCMQDPYVQTRKWNLGAETICAKTQLGSSASCDGDSGGPLLQKQNDTFVQIGVVSWGSACNPAFKNNQADVEGYASVAAAYPWIQSLVGF